MERNYSPRLVRSTAFQPISSSNGSASQPARARRSGKLHVQRNVIPLWRCFEIQMTATRDTLPKVFQRNHRGRSNEPIAFGLSEHPATAQYLTAFEKHASEIWWQSSFHFNNSRRSATDGFCGWKPNPLTDTFGTLRGIFFRLRWFSDCVEECNAVTLRYSEASYTF